MTVTVVVPEYVLARGCLPGTSRRRSRAGYAGCPLHALCKGPARLRGLLGGAPATPRPPSSPAVVVDPHLSPAGARHPGRAELNIALAREVWMPRDHATEGDVHHRVRREKRCHVHASNRIGCVADRIILGLRGNIKRCRSGRPQRLSPWHQWLVSATRDDSDQEERSKYGCSESGRVRSGHDPAMVLSHNTCPRDGRLGRLPASIRHVASRSARKQSRMA